MSTPNFRHTFTKNSSVINTIIGAVLASSSSVLLLPTAQAQATDLPLLEEITITAQRREETLQKSSLAIEVLNSAALQKAGITAAADISSAAPGVQVGMGGPAAQVYIRGVGDYGATSVSNPAIAFNVDGVYVARSQAIAGSFFDLDRMEILKGPQGTLYGRNASGGAVNLVAAKPKLGESGGFAQIDVQNYDGVSVEAALNLALGTSAAARVSVQSGTRDGYLSDGTNDDDHQSVRVQLLVQPNEQFDARLWGSYSHSEGKGVGFVLYDPAGTPAVGRPASIINDPWTSIASPQGNAIIAGANAVFNQQRGPSPSPWLESFDASKLYQDMRFYNVHAEVNWHMDWATLTVIPAYQSASMGYRILPVVNYESKDDKGSPETSYARSMEVRLGNNTEQLKWVLGGFYFDETQQSRSTINNGFIQRLILVGEQATTSYAAFGQATYSLSDPLRLILGARYTHEEKDALFDRYNFAPSAGCFAGPNVALLCYDDTVPNGPNSKVTDSAFNYRVGAEFDVTADNMLFVTVASGFKAGGIVQAAFKPFGPEKLTALTLGSRNRFFNDSVQLNLEGFYYDYQDHQEFIIATDQTGKTGAFLVNAGDATSYGASADLVWAPTRAQQIRVAGEYVHARYDSFKYEQPDLTIAPGSTACKASPTGRSVNIGAPIPAQILELDCSGYPLIRTPKWSGLASYNYTFDFSGGATLNAGVDMTYAGERWLTTAFIGNVLAPSYTLWNANATFTSAQGLQITGYVRNIGNEAVYTGAGQDSFVGGLVAANIGAPRTYGVRLRLNF